MGGIIVYSIFHGLSFIISKKSRVGHSAGVKKKIICESEILNLQWKQEEIKTRQGEKFKMLICCLMHLQLQLRLKLLIS